ncbi:peptide-binding protein [Niabella ginsenosidivorans]|uniref:Peptide-binding protein n=1 Tax=Niabella ginsenosidivorans TaxID=1176587 RepID=A0A1A9I821_9BACT|nr:peptide-binding protein [Niabella ginsenosidivorans]
MKTSQGLKTGAVIKVPLTANNLTRSKKGIPVYYEVSGKDNLTTISHKFNGVAVKTLKSWNNLKKDVVVKGQDLLVGYLVNNAASKDDKTDDQKKSDAVAQKEQKKGKAATGKSIEVGTAINIRKKPGTDQPIVGRIEKDETVTIIKQVNKEWSSVRTGKGVEGYAATQYLVPASNVNEEPAKPATEKVQVGTAINVRKGPGTDQPIVGRIEKDETVTIIKQVDKEWSSVRTSKGIEGYAATQYLTPAPAANENENTAKTTVQKVQVGTAVNVRKGPGTDQPVVGRIEKDETISIIKQVNDEWSSVRTSNGVEGYAATQYLVPAPAGNETAAKPEAQKVTVGTAVNLRKGPGTDQPVIGRIQKDETITILKQVNGEWSSVRTGSGVEGYAATQYLTPGNEATAQNNEEVAAVKKPETATRSNTRTNQEVSSAPVADVTPAAANYDQSGFFKTAYESQSGNASTTDQPVRAGTFKTDKGWADGKYYALIDGVPAGTIVKLSNPGNNTSIYAKVLGDVKSLKQKDQLGARISDAAATALRINESDFDLVVTH